MTVPLTKQAAAIRYLRMALDPKKQAKAAEAFRQAYKVELSEAIYDAQMTLEAMREST